MALKWVVVHCLFRMKRVFLSYYYWKHVPYVCVVFEGHRRSGAICAPTSPLMSPHSLLSKGSDVPIEIFCLHIAAAVVEAAAVAAGA